MSRIMQKEIKSEMNDFFFAKDHLDFYHEYVNVEQKYLAGIKEVRTKLEILDDEFHHRFDHNPIHHMEMCIRDSCFIDYLENGFKEFLLDDSGDELTKEYLLPIIVDQLIKTNRASVKVLETTDKSVSYTHLILLFNKLINFLICICNGNIFIKHIYSFICFATYS